MVVKWGIYFVNLNPIQGSEQRGTRPVLVISNDAVNAHFPTCTIIPFTSYKGNGKIYPTEVLLQKHITGLPKDSILMIHQIRTIDKTRIQSQKAGEVRSQDVQLEINIKLKQYFDL